MSAVGSGPGLPDAATKASAYSPGSKSPRDLPFEGIAVEGMRVELSAAKGVTDKGVLKVPYRFQMPPMDTFTRTLTHNFNDFDTLRAGQHSQSLGPGLTTITFQTLVVDFDWHYAVWPRSTAADNQLDDADRDDIWNVLSLTADLEDICSRGTPVRLKCGNTNLWDGGGTGSGWDVNMLATLRTLTIEEHTGEMDTRYLNVEFHEYRKLELQRKRYGKKKGGGKKGSRGHASETPTTVEVFADGSALDRGNHDHKLFSNDPGHEASLARLAKYFYGDASDYKQIIVANSLLQRFNWVGNRNLGALSSTFLGGRSFKLAIPRDRTQSSDPAGKKAHSASAGLDGTDA